MIFLILENIKKGILSCLSNISVVVATAVYVGCVAYIITEMRDHGELFGLSDINLIEPEPDDIKTFSFVLILLSVSGCMMFLSLASTSLNVARLTKERERTLLESENRLRAIESCVDGIAILDSNGFCIYANQSLANHYGFSCGEDIIGKSWRFLYYPSEAARFDATVFSRIDKQGAWSGPAQGKRADGTEFPQEVSIRKLDNNGYVCIVRNLCEKVEQDHLMRIIKLAVEAAYDGIALTDEEGRIVFLNKSFLRIHGYDPADHDSYIGVDWRSFYNEAGQKQINNIVLPTMMLKGTWSGQTTVMRKDGALFHGDASLTRLSDGLVLGVMRDITDRRNAEIERYKLKESLFHAQKIESVGRITQRIASEFKVILQGLNEAVEGDDQFGNKKIRYEVGKANDLLDRLMVFSNDDNVVTTQNDLVPLMRSVIEGLNGPEDIAVFYDPKIEKADVRLGKEQIRILVSSIYQNAIESMEGNSGMVLITIDYLDQEMFDLFSKVKAGELSLEGRYFFTTGVLSKEKEYVRISIADDGCGIDPDILPYIFDPFFSTKENKKGVGLGLSSVHGIVSASGGAIFVETGFEHGTNINLFIPYERLVEEGYTGLAA